MSAISLIGKVINNYFNVICSAEIKHNASPKEMNFCFGTLLTFNVPRFIVTIDVLTIGKVDREEVFKALKTLKPKKGLDCHGIPPIILKQLRLQIVQPMTALINQCVVESCWPSDLKISRTVPLPKNQNTSKVENYRPISLTSSISKVFERIIYNRIEHHLLINNVLGANQFGFRQGHSTSHAITKVVSQICLNRAKQKKGRTDAAGPE